MKTDENLYLFVCSKVCVFSPSPRFKRGMIHVCEFSLFAHGTGILSNNMRSPSPEFYTTFWMMAICDDALHLSGITPIFDPVAGLGLVAGFDFLPNCERLRRVRRAGPGGGGGACSSGRLVLSYFGTCRCSNVETNLS